MARKSRGQELLGAFDAILQLEIKSVDNVNVWLAWFVSRACLAWQTTWFRQSRRLLAGQLLEEACIMFTHAIIYLSVFFLAWPNNAPRGRNPNQVLMWCSICFVKVLWDQAICCCASSWMQSVGGQQVDQALSLLKSHMPSGISIQEVSVHLNSIEEFEWWVLTLTLPTPTGPKVFAGLGGWAYCWTNVVGLGAGRYCSLHLLKCQDGWLASLLALPMAR